MGDILPFVARVRAGGDWTASERARLQDLADQFSAGGAHVEVVFGTTEEGDPWCVVKDDQEEVLVHVARIGGKFVVHYAAEDALEEGADLHTTLSDRLQAEAAHDDVVVPFGVSGRHAQTFIALVVAAAFFYETQDVAEAAETHDEPLELQHAPEAPPQPSDEDHAVRQDRDLAASSSAFIEPAPAPVEHAAWTPPPEATSAASGALTTAEAEPEAARVEAAHVEEPQAVAAADVAPTAVRNEINGTRGDDLLVGTSGADHIRGGDGADTLQGGGAGQGQFDVLDGGAGDDRIELNAQVIATGGKGADTFVIAAPVVMGQASTLLGVLTDFNAADGDRLVNAGGQVLLTSQPPAPPAVAPPMTAGDRGGDPPQTETHPAFTPPTILPGRQVEVDIDGDGQVDGYVVMTSVREPAAYDLPKSEPSPELVVSLVGLGFDYGAVA